MNAKRTLIASIAAYTATLVVSIIVFMVLSRGAQSELRTTDDILWGTSMIINAAAAIGAAWWFFKKEKPSLDKGIKLGGAIVLTALVLDAVLILPSMPAGEVLTQYYTNAYFWATITLIIFAASATARFLEKRRHKTTDAKKES